LLKKFSRQLGQLKNIGHYFQLLHLATKGNQKLLVAQVGDRKHGDQSFWVMSKLFFTHWIEGCF
jgi:predicted oxidoreductase